MCLFLTKHTANGYFFKFQKFSFILLRSENTSIFRSFNGKLKSRSDFEDEDSELLAELGLLRESNKKPRGYLFFYLCQMIFIDLSCMGAVFWAVLL